MSVPTTLFIDTSIFDKAAYNFEAASIVAFKEAIDGMDLTLLMPDPTGREIRRHISDRSASAVKSLEGAARKAPFLYKLSSWPLNGTNSTCLKYQIQNIVSQALSSFLNLFQVVKLEYDGVNLQEIMDWHDLRRAPFSEKKKGEFPDALAIASINHYHANNSGNIAIISIDRDFRSACERYPHLLYFQSLASFVETIKSKDERVASIHEALEANDDDIRKAIANAFNNSGFLLEADWNGDICDTELTGYDFLDHHVVGLGEDTCTITFDGKIFYEAEVSYDDYDNARWEGGEAYPMHRIEGTVEDTAHISGIVKLRVINNGEKIDGVDDIILDQSDFTITGVPEEQW